MGVLGWEDKGEELRIGGKGHEDCENGVSSS